MQRAREDFDLEVDIVQIVQSLRFLKLAIGSRMTCEDEREYREQSRYKVMRESDDEPVRDKIDKRDDISHLEIGVT